MKRIIFIFLFSLQACTLTLISPGINSNYRLDNLTGKRFEEAAFYGSKYYQPSAYFIESDNLELIINDVNNATFNKDEIPNFKQFDQNKIYILYEYCYDKEKDINIFEDINHHQFQLNNNFYESKISYFYPYSFYKRGNTITKKHPFYKNAEYPSNKVILKTGTDFLMCVRTILVFNRENQMNSKNEFEILTPRNSHLFFSYDYKNKFIYYEKEEMDFSAK